MTYSIYALLSKDCPEVTLAALQDGLRSFFSRTDEGTFTLELEEDPFNSDEKNILLTWDGKWWTRFFYEVGPDVVHDSQVISELLKSDQSNNVAEISRRIRVLFADDKSHEYTNHLIFTIDFLQEIPGVLVFDSSKKALL